MNVVTNLYDFGGKSPVPSGTITGLVYSQHPLRGSWGTLLAVEYKSNTTGSCCVFESGTNIMLAIGDVASGTNWTRWYPLATQSADTARTALGYASGGTSPRFDPGTPLALSGYGFVSGTGFYFSGAILYQ